MNKIVILSALGLSMTLNTFAQDDDMYFSKKRMKRAEPVTTVTDGKFDDDDDFEARYRRHRWEATHRREADNGYDDEQPAEQPRYSSERMENGGGNDVIMLDSMATAPADYHDAYQKAPTSSEKSVSVEQLNRAAKDARKEGE